LALFLVAHENTYKWYVSNYFIPYTTTAEWKRALYERFGGFGFDLPG
jgi:hypothetical protein